MRKQLMGAVLGVLVLFSVAQVQAAGEIRLVGVRTSDCPPVSGCYRDIYQTADIEVANLGYAKQVGIAYLQASSGQWVTEPAVYVSPTRDGRELWTVTTWPSDAYAFYYTVNGVTYWDNNGGKNYSTDRYIYGGLLGAGEMIGMPRGSVPLQGGQALVDVIVRNNSYTKTIDAVYTQDGWATPAKVAPGKYIQTMPNGFELWQFVVPVTAIADTSKFQLAFSYKWSAGSTWDNNFGRNYRLNQYGRIVR